MFERGKLSRVTFRYEIFFRGSRGRVSQVAGSRRTRSVSWGHEYILGMGQPWKVESKIEKRS